MTKRNDKKFVPDRLRYCGDCRTPNTWERYPQKDMQSEAGKVFEYAFKCRVCGKVTYEPTLE